MKSYLLPFVLFFSVLSLPLAVIAQDEHHAEPPQHEMEHFSNPWNTDHEGSEIFAERQENETDTFQAKFLHMLLVLGLLIAFMLLASWALKKMMKSRVTQMNTGSSIKVIETRYLSPRSSVYIIDVNGQNFLLGESPSTVTLLAALPPQSHEE